MDEKNMLNKDISAQVIERVRVGGIGIKQSGFQTKLLDFHFAQENSFIDCSITESLPSFSPPPPSPFIKGGT